VSSSLLRGLRVLEMLAEEPLGVSEVARRLDLDKAGVSRMLTALHREGWVRRTGPRYVLAERALRLPHDPAVVLDRAGAVARELHAHTGLACVVLRLAGAAAQPVALEADDLGFLDPEAPFEHLWCTAGGIALLSQLGDPAVAAHLEHADDPGAVWALVRSARSAGLVEERGWGVPGVGCLAAPWSVPGARDPLVVALVGPLDALDAPGVTDRLLTVATAGTPPPASLLPKATPS
jgi:IclR family transcriptional regulator, acetate operon repressor